MLCFVYKSLKKMDAYLFIATKDDFSQVPEALRQMLGRLEFVMEVDLHKREKLAQAGPQQIREQLQQQGYYLQLPPSTEHYNT